MTRGRGCLRSIKEASLWLVLRDRKMCRHQFSLVCAEFLLLLRALWLYGEETSEDEERKSAHAMRPAQEARGWYACLTDVSLYSHSATRTDENRKETEYSVRVKDDRSFSTRNASEASSIDRGIFSSYWMDNQWTISGLMFFQLEAFQQVSLSTDGPKRIRVTKEQHWWIHRWWFSTCFQNFSRPWRRGHHLFDFFCPNQLEVDQPIGGWCLHYMLMPGINQCGNKSDEGIRCSNKQLSQPRSSLPQRTLSIFTFQGSILADSLLFESFVWKSFTC